MYATTISLADSSPVSTSASSIAFRKTLDAVYRRCGAGLRETARLRLRNSADSLDAVQNALLFVLERPPRDVTERSIESALEAAVREACNRQGRQRRADVDLKIGLRKRFPV